RDAGTDARVPRADSCPGRRRGRARPAPAGRSAATARSLAPPEQPPLGNRAARGGRASRPTHPRPEGRKSMTPKKALVAGLLCLGLVGPAPAQEVPQRVAVVFDREDTRLTKIYEDVEILRRILNRKLAELYPTGHWYHGRNLVNQAANSNLWLAN